MTWLPVCPLLDADGDPCVDEAGAPLTAPPPWLPWLVILLALVVSGLALRALFCAS